MATAANACGAPVANAVTCAPGAYGAGISYAPDAALTLTLQQSALAAPTVTNGGVTITAAGTDVSLVRSYFGAAAAGSPAPSIINMTGPAISLTNSAATGNLIVDLSDPASDAGIVLDGHTDGVLLSGQGAISYTQTDGSITAHGGAALDIAQGANSTGAITVNTGAASLNSTAGEGILIQAQGPSNVDPISVTLGGPLQALGTGVLVSAGSARDITITTLSGGAIVAGSNGISAQTAQTGKITVTTNANILSDSNNGGVGDAIDLKSVDGDIALTTAAGTTLSVGTTPPPAGLTKELISLTSGAGAINVNNAANLENGVASASQFYITGLRARTTNGGSITVTSSGAIGQFGDPIGGNGIDLSATGGGVGALTLNNTGAITVFHTGISAVTAGSGAVNVTSSGVVTAVNGLGVLTGAQTGATTIDVNADISGAFGVQSTSNGGDVTLNNIATIATSNIAVNDELGVASVNSGTAIINNAMTGAITGGGGTEGTATLYIINATNVQINNSGYINTNQTAHAGYFSFLNNPSGSAANAATLTITNNASGFIDGGFVNNTNGATTFNNAGTWRTATVQSVFGLANNGVLVNSGLIQVGLDGPMAAATTTTTFTGLASFNNNGTLSLSNGLAGDVLSVTGNYAGGAGSVLKLDLLSGSTPLADQLHIGGAASGATTVVINLVGTPALVSKTPIVTTGGASSPTAFGLPNGVGRQGLTQLAIVYDASANVYSLTSSLNAAALEMGRFGEIRHEIYYQSEAVWSSHLDQYRSLAAHRTEVDEGFHVWGSPFGGGGNRSGSLSFTTAGVTSAANVGYSHSYAGVQFGLDVVEAVEGGSALLGVTAGYTYSDAKFQDVGDRLTTNDFNIGAYAAYIHDGLFVNALAKFDPGDVHVNSPYAGYQHSLRSGQVGLTLEVGKRLDLQSWYIEPAVSLTGLRGFVSGNGVASSAADYTVQGIAVKFPDDASLQARVGFRAGTAPMPAFGGMMTPYGGLAFVDEIAGKDKVMFSSGGATVSIHNSSLGAYAEARLGADLVHSAGLSVSAEVKGAFGSMTSGGAQIVVRHIW